MRKQKQQAEQPLFFTIMKTGNRWGAYKKDAKKASWAFDKKELCIKYTKEKHPSCKTIHSCGNFKNIPTVIKSGSKNVKDGKLVVEMLNGDFLMNKEAKIPKSVMLTARVKDDIYDLIEKYAKENNLTKSEAIRDILTKEIKFPAEVNVEPIPSTMNAPTSPTITAKQITYERLINLGDYQHEKIGIVLQIPEGMKAMDVLNEAKRFVDSASTKQDDTDKKKYDYSMMVVKSPDFQTVKQVRDAEEFVKEYENRQNEVTDFPF